MDVCGRGWGDPRQDTTVSVEGRVSTGTGRCGLYPFKFDADTVDNRTILGSRPFREKHSGMPAFLPDRSVEV